MRWVDKQMWNALGGPEVQVFPEVEFIRYQGAENQPPGPAGNRKYAIEPHVDNHSGVTFVCLLSRADDFDGGVLGFKAVEPNGLARRLKLTQGDAVAFRGEKLVHWVT